MYVIPELEAFKLPLGFGRPGFRVYVLTATCHGDLVSRLIIWITKVTIWGIGLFTYLLSPPNPPSRLEELVSKG